MKILTVKVCTKQLDHLKLTQETKMPLWVVDTLDYTWVWNILNPAYNLYFSKLATPLLNKTCLIFGERQRGLSPSLMVSLT